MHAAAPPPHRLARAVPPEPPAVVALRWALVALAAALVATGAAAVLRYGWHDLYADAWRIYGRMLALGFPLNVLALENGHRPVLPSLLRLAELHLLDANHVLQGAVGLALAVASVVAGAWRIARDASLAPLARAAASAALAAAVFWLGNARMLMHPLEAVQTYLVLAMLVAGAIAAGRVVDGPARGAGLAACIACGTVATFSFGTGIVAFPALAVTLVAARAPWRTVAGLAAGLAAALAAYVLLPGGNAVAGLAGVDPWRNLQVAAQWLASPLHAYTLPLRLLGAPRIAAWGSAPGAGTWIGLAGVAALTAMTLACRRRGRAGATERLGLTLGWFAVGAAALVALVRLDYFAAHPAQLYAPRYLPWPCLLWASLALLALGAPRRAGAPLPWAAAIAVALVALGALAQQKAWADWSRGVQTMLRHHAVVALADLWSTSRYAGETVGDEVKGALPALRERRIAMFAHPAASLLGTRLASLPTSVVAPQRLRVAAYASDAGTPAVDFEAGLARDPARPRAPLWLVTDAQGVVVGYAHPAPLRARGTLSGVARAPPDGTLLAFPWVDGRVVGPGVRLALPPSS